VGEEDPEMHLNVVDLLGDKMSRSKNKYINRANRWKPQIPGNNIPNAPAYTKNRVPELPSIFTIINVWSKKTGLAESDIIECINTCQSGDSLQHEGVLYSDDCMVRCTNGNT
jgi:hypothetical protein